MRSQKGRNQKSERAALLGYLKQLTVEGTVSVTLTLSAAAPYKIVSALPTLSPGQSAAVTVRFDPSESGSFTGNVQVGINGGQGSVSSSPLVGTAHKIEIDPPELSFGLVFVDSTREQKLTVKNQGVTNVPLTVSAVTPFSVVSDGSFVLSPGENREVVVQFNPTTSGNTQGSIRLTSGIVFKEFPATGMAYTEEELRAFLRQQLQSEIETCQASQRFVTTPSIAYLPTPEDNSLLYGFDCVSEEELEQILDFIMSGLGTSDPDGTQPMLDSVPIFLGGPWNLSAFMSALEYLIQNYDNFDSAFRAAYQGTAPWSPVFQTFVDTVNSVSFLGPFNLNRDLFGNDPGRQAVLALVTLLKDYPQLVQILDHIGQRLAQVSQPDKVGENQLLAFYVVAEMYQGAFVDKFITAGMTVSLAVQFVYAMEYLLDQPTNSRAFQAMSALVGIIALGYGPEGVSLLQLLIEGRNAEAMANAAGQAISLANLVENDWIITFVGVLAQDRQRAYDRRITIPVGLDMVAQRIVYGRETTAFVHVQAKLNSDEISSIANTLLRIAELVADDTWREGFLSTFGDPNYLDSQGVVVHIAFQANTTTIGSLLQALYDGSPNVPIVIIWADENGIVHATAVCPVSGCPGGLSEAEYALEIATAMDFPPGQPANEEFRALEVYLKYYWWYAWFFECGRMSMCLEP